MRITDSVVIHSAVLNNLWTFLPSLFFEMMYEKMWILPAYCSFSLICRGFKDFLASSYANALDNKHFSSNAGDAIRRAVARALIGGGGYIHIFKLCPTNFF